MMAVFAFLLSFFASSALGGELMYCAGIDGELAYNSVSERFEHADGTAVSASGSLLAIDDAVVGILGEDCPVLDDDLTCLSGEEVTAIPSVSDGDKLLCNEGTCTYVDPPTGPGGYWSCEDRGGNITQRWDNPPYPRGCISVGPTNVPPMITSWDNGNCGGL